MPPAPALVSLPGTEREREREFLVCSLCETVVTVLFADFICETAVTLLATKERREEKKGKRDGA